jgi:hypothetical protein
MSIHFETGGRRYKLRELDPGSVFNVSGSLRLTGAKMFPPRAAGRLRVCFPDGSDMSADVTLRLRGSWSGRGGRRQYCYHVILSSESEGSAEELTTDTLRALLGSPGDGAREARFDGEGGIRP